MAVTAASTIDWPAPRSAYIHVPFCRHRCGYCNFSVVANRNDLIERYLNAIDLELRPLGQPLVETIFIGGGTPTHFDPVTLERFLGLIHSHFSIAASVEWSMEANPEDITPQKVSILEQHGVNRVSLGVQSFQPRKLKLLERGHSASSASAAVETVAKQIPNVSLDLIFAAPDESVADWRDDLKTALGLPITHLSTYALTFEKGTSFWTRRDRGDLRGVGESVEVEMYNAARELTSDTGMHHYEISNFAKRESRCRHNLAYWNGSGWYAAGPGAARFVDGRRDANHRSTTTYLKRMESGQNPVAETEVLTPESYARERVAFGVRMIDGVDLDAIHQQTGVDMATLCHQEIEQSIAEGLLVSEQPHFIRLTTNGVLFADLVASRFLG